MAPRPLYIASDVHLGAVPREREESFRSWLFHAAEHASSVVINGDLFDFWFEYRHAVPRGHSRMLGALAEIVDGGTPVLMLGGNHDWWGGSFLRDEIGIDFRQDPVVLEHGSRKLFIAHGDGLGRGDLGYRALRRVLRGRLTRSAFRWLHPDLGALIARGVSKTESYGEEPTAADRARSNALRAWALEKLEAEADLDIVVLGHTHIPERIEASPGRFYLNAGDWIRNDSFIVVEEGVPPRLERWRPPERG